MATAIVIVILAILALAGFVAACVHAHSLSMDALRERDNNDVYLTHCANAATDAAYGDRLPQAVRANVTRWRADAIGNFAGGVFFGACVLLCVLLGVGFGVFALQALGLDVVPVRDCVASCWTIAALCVLGFAMARAGALYVYSELCDAFHDSDAAVEALSEYWVRVDDGHTREPHPECHYIGGWRCHC